MNRNSFIVANIPIESNRPQHMDGIYYDAKVNQWVYRQVRDGRDGKDCDCSHSMDTYTRPEIVYFTNGKQDVKKGEDLVLHQIYSTFQNDTVSLIGQTTVRIKYPGMFEVTFSAGRNEFSIMNHKGSNFTFPLLVGADGADIKCNMLSIAKLVEENTCALKIVRIE